LQFYSHKNIVPIYGQTTKILKNGIWPRLAALLFHPSHRRKIQEQQKKLFRIHSLERFTHFPYSYKFLIKFSNKFFQKTQKTVKGARDYPKPSLTC
jgi:hypothetical protein